MTQSTVVHGPASDNLGKPQRSPPHSMNHIPPPPPENEECFTDLESRAGRGGMDTGTGRHTATQPLLLLLLHGTNSPLPADSANSAPAVLQTHLAVHFTLTCCWKKGKTLALL